MLTLFPWNYWSMGNKINRWRGNQSILTARDLRAFLLRYPSTPAHVCRWEDREITLGSFASYLGRDLREGTSWQ